MTVATGLPERLAQALTDVRARLGVPEDFPPDVLAAARTATADLPGRVDATDIAFVTIDPPGSMDLDQALHLERSGNCFRFRYAIADVFAFVKPASPIDLESRTRGETVYLPDGTVPLHPRELSEGRASLLPAQVRPAVVWTIDIAADGEPTFVDLRRSTIRSTARLDYAEVQQAVDTKAATGSVELLPEVGELLLARQERRGAVDLQVPEQEVVVDGGEPHVVLRNVVRAEAWNAQLSLLTGEIAASLMVQAGVGLLRVLPPPALEAIGRLRAIATALQVPWPDGVSATHWADALRALDPRDPHAAAVLRAATRVTGSASYLAFDGDLPEQHAHAGVGGAYAHVTAPLRRLADRYATEVCLSHVAGVAVPDGVRAFLPALPAVMKSSAHRAHAAERAALDVVEAWVLSSHIGSIVDAVVVAEGLVMLPETAVVAKATGDLPLGERVRCRVVAVDVATGAITLHSVGASAGSPAAGRDDARPAG